MSSETTERYRLVVLGPSQVGKTCIVRRYLNNTFSERYKETVEDIYSRDFRVHGTILPLDIYDTNFSYPDMRRVSVASANAFLLVFAVDNVSSFKDVTELYQEICTRRAQDIKDVPVVIVGNKSDVSVKKILPETVHAWTSHLHEAENVRYLETSAKTSSNIVEIFQTLLELSGYPYSLQNAGGFLHNLLTPSVPRRTMSTRAKTPVGPRHSGGKEAKPASNLLSPEAGGAEGDDAETTVVGRFGRALARKTLALTESQPAGGFLSAEPASGEHKKVTRHNSLMRRTQRLSLRLKHAEPDAPDESDCKIQ